MVPILIKIEFLNNDTIISSIAAFYSDINNSRISLLQAFDSNLKLINNLYNIDVKFNDKIDGEGSIMQYNGTGSMIYKYNNEIYFFGPRQDTVFQLGNDLGLTPKYIFKFATKGRNDNFQNQEDWIKSPRPYPIHQTKDYLFFKIFYLPPKLDVAAVYDKNSNEAYSFSHRKNCYYSFVGVSGPVNNMDGVDKFFTFYIKENDIYSDILEIADLKYFKETKCIDKIDLITDKYKNELYKLVKKSKIDDNPIVRIIHLKK